MNLESIRFAAAPVLLRRIAVLRLGLAIAAAQLGACAEPGVPPPQAGPPAGASAAAMPPPDPSEHWCDLRSRVCR